MATQAPATTPTAAVKPIPIPLAIPRWEQRIQHIVIVIARLVLAYLFLANLGWKMPPRFGCANEFAFPTTTADGRIQADRSTGLCYYLGLESFYAPKPRQIFVAQLHNAGGPDLSIDISPVAQLNAAFIDGFVKPNIRWFGYVIWGAEAFIAITMFLGLFSRLGGLVALGVSAQLMIGLANIPAPFEWEWSYNLMVTLALLMFALAPGRHFGLDGFIRRWAAPIAARGNLLARLLLIVV
ncbi:MAG: TQO small subunit DoxD [Roseiflexaceae bacterium]|nr:TQO small subunit DoxD [Roseiflexaceae bacterium]